MKTVLKCFPGGKTKALTMSYDDNQIFDRRLVEIFNKYGIKGTFHIISGTLDMEGRITSKEVKELYSGHEVACHCLTHPVIARCPDVQVAQEIIEDRKKLESLVGYPVRGLSYPFGSYSKSIMQMLPVLGIEYSRIVDSTGDFVLPENFYEWRPTCHHDYKLMELGQSFLNEYNIHLKLMYVWGHSFEFDRNNNWGLIEDFCKEVGGNTQIWYATNIEIFDYLKALENLKFTAECDLVYNPSATSVWVKVDEKVIEIPGGAQLRLY